MCLVGAAFLWNQQVRRRKLRQRSTPTVKAFLSLYLSSFNKFARVYRALACSSHSGVTCHPSTPVRSTAKKPQPHHSPPGTPKIHPSPCPNRHTVRLGIGSPNQDRKARLIGPGSQRGSAAPSPPESGPNRHPKRQRRATRPSFTRDIGEHHPRNDSAPDWPS